MKITIFKKKLKKRDIMPEVVLTLMYIAASLVFIDRMRYSFDVLQMRKLGLGLCSTYFILKYIKNNNRGLRRIAVPFKVRYWSLPITWALFSLTVILSQVINREMPIEGLVYLIINPLLFFLIVPISIDKAIEKILYATFFSGFAFMIISIINEPFMGFYRGYSGITYNPNSLGQLAAQSTIASFCIFLEAIRSKSKTRSFIFIFFLTFSFAMLLLSQSRTSLLSVFVACLIGFLFFVEFNIVKIKKFIVPGIIFIGIYFLKLRELLYEGIIYKFSRVSDSAGVLNYRDILWRNILNQMNIFGYPQEYADTISAHNSILSIVINFGVISGMFLLMLYIITFIASVKYAFNYWKNKYSYAPLVVVVLFLILSMGESMFGVVGKGITLIYFNIIGVLTLKKINGCGNNAEKNR